MVKNETTWLATLKSFAPCNWRFSRGPYSAIYGGMAARFLTEGYVAALKIPRSLYHDD
jgi:hypothetical protein